MKTINKLKPEWFKNALLKTFQWCNRLNIIKLVVPLIINTKTITYPATIDNSPMLF